MKKRCYDPSHEAYDRYGGKGIVVCDTWKDSFIEFQDWAHKNGYAENLTIDRIDNDKGYCPENCRWATMKEQQNNRSNNRILEYDGIEMDVAQWAAAMGFPNANIIHDRLARGWSIQETLETPVDSARRNKLAKGNQLKVTVKRLVGWDAALNLARNTVNKPMIEKEPSEAFKVATILPEHSPIRAVTFWVQLENIEYSTSVHLSRHFTGVVHCVGTQRSDRTGVDRDALPQTNLVNHIMVLNAQALIFISRRRLCGMASSETRKLWKMVIDEVAKIDPVLARYCVPECIFRGFCPESHSCGYVDSANYAKRLMDYRGTCRKGQE